MNFPVFSLQKKKAMTDKTIVCHEVLAIPDTTTKRFAKKNTIAPAKIEFEIVMYKNFYSYIKFEYESITYVFRIDVWSSAYSGSPKSARLCDDSTLFALGSHAFYQFCELYTHPLAREDFEDEISYARASRVVNKSLIKMDIKANDDEALCDGKKDNEELCTKLKLKKAHIMYILRLVPHYLLRVIEKYKKMVGAAVGRHDNNSSSKSRIQKHHHHASSLSPLGASLTSSPNIVNLAVLVRENFSKNYRKRMKEERVTADLYEKYMESLVCNCIVHANFGSPLPFRIY